MHFQTASHASTFRPFANSGGIRVHSEWGVSAHLRSWKVGGSLVQVRLLADDRRMHKDLRESGISLISQSGPSPTAATFGITRPTGPTQPHTHSITTASDTQSQDTTGQESASEPELAPDEEMTPYGWVRKKASQMTLKTKNRGQNANASASQSTEGKERADDYLAYFRVDARTLEKTKVFQIMSFTGGRLLTDEQRMKRKVVYGSLID